MTCLIETGITKRYLIQLHTPSGFFDMASYIDILIIGLPEEHL